MSAAAASTRPASRPEKIRDDVRELKVIEGHKPRRSFLPIAALTVLILVIAVVGSMVLNTRMAQTAFDIRQQQLELNELDAQAWSMQAELEKLASPSALQQAAIANGMVPAGTTGFITLSTGTVEGGTPAR